MIDLWLDHRRIIHNRYAKVNALFIIFLQFVTEMQKFYIEIPVKSRTVPDLHREYADDRMQGR